MRSLVGIVLAGCVLSGCILTNINQTQKLNDAVQDYSDATRWNRMDLAVQLVDLTYRDAFLKRHAGWGRSVEVADAEVMGIQTAPDGHSAMSTLAYSWYDLSAMTLARTVVRQTWDLTGPYRVIKEEVVDGVAELLPEPTPSADDEPDTVASAQ